MKHLVAAAVCSAVLIGPLVTVARAQTDISAEEVRTAIEKAVSYLKHEQHADGSWADYFGQTGGVTSLCTLALLNAGVDPKEECLQRALANLRKLPLKTTYVVSLQTMVLCRAEPEKDQMLIGRNVEWLQDKQLREGARAGAWSYPVGNGDNSNSQFALLALHEAERAAEAGYLKVQVRREVWERARRYWQESQNPDGSWGYYKPLYGTGSMTCAGISSLVIAADMIHQPDARVVGDRIDCCAPRAEDDKQDHIERGLDWLRQNFSITANPGMESLRAARAAALSQTWHLYYLYGLERAGRLTARRFIGEHDWYREGTDYFLHNPAGKQATLSDSFPGSGHAEDDKNISTSLALLFLTKGRRPVLLAKLKYGEAEDWNRRRNDIHNLTLYVESRWKRELSWQVIELDKATVDDLLQVPVLYLAGGRSPLPATEEKRQQLGRKLRDYIDRGGFLFAEGDCCTVGFDKGFRDLMEYVFPEKEYRLKKLDAGHPIWHAEEKVEQLRPLEGIDFGCRTSVVYARPDPPAEPRPSLSCLWEVSRSGRQQKFSQAVQDQINAGRAIGINVLAYATNRELKWRYDIPQTFATQKSTDNIQRGRLYVAKLRHPGGCDAAPRAVTNLMESAAREFKIRTEVRPNLLDITNPALFDYHLVFMHGRNSFHFTDAERAQLKTYIERGGMLFADAICANKAFADSFRAEMKAIFPKNALTPIPPKDPIWTTAYGGADLATVTRRDPQPAAAGGPLKDALRKVPPDLEAIKLGDRYGVIFSAFDLSCALEKQDSLECRGYTREDAARIGLNVLLYSVQQ